ncbi:MAG: Hpt domain-containing protein, partial [Gammaproteobacteria bacterium]
TRLAAADRAIAPTLALDDFSVCAASRMASRSGTAAAFSSVPIRRGASSRKMVMMRVVSSPAISRIITIFLEDAPRLIGTLEKAAAVPDLDAMRDAAHTLKSSSANVGAMALSAAAKRVELGARARKLERPAVAVALVIAEYARARMALQGYAAQQLGRPLLPVPPQARPPSPAQPAPATPQSSSLVNR